VVLLRTEKEVYPSKSAAGREIGWRRMQVDYEAMDRATRLCTIVPNQREYVYSANSNSGLSGSVLDSEALSTMVIRKRARRMNPDAMMMVIYSAWRRKPWVAVVTVAASQDSEGLGTMTVALFTSSCSMTMAVRFPV